MRQIILDESHFDYEDILAKNKVDVIKAYDSEWYLSWGHGVINIGPTTELFARKSAAMFVQLWLLGVAAPLAKTLMKGYLVWLEKQ